jgi:hypothetical protein
MHMSSRGLARQKAGEFIFGILTGVWSISSHDVAPSAPSFGLKSFFFWLVSTRLTQASETSTVFCSIVLIFSSKRAVAKLVFFSISRLIVMLLAASGIRTVFTHVSIRWVVLIAGRTPAK